MIFSIKIIYISLNKIEIFDNEVSKQFSVMRRDIVDRNGILISRNVKFFHAAVNPKNIINKENFLIKIRINFPDIEIKKIKKT